MHQSRCLARSSVNAHRLSPCLRSGKILVLLAIMLPTLFGMTGLVIDGGLMMSEYRNLQHVADAASTAAAMQLRLGKGVDEATQTAEDVVMQGNGLADASVIVNIPPLSGRFAGRSGHAEVTVTTTYDSYFMHVVSGIIDRTIRARSVAGVEDVTAGAAIVILDPDPNHLSYPTPNEIISEIDEADIANEIANQADAAAFLAQVPVVGPLAAGLLNSQLGELMPDVVSNLTDQIVGALPTISVPALIGGLEVEGLGRLEVDGAIHINTKWGGRDENGELVGESAGPPYALTCMPILPTTRVRARDIRVVGGVDNPDYYRAFDPQDRPPLQANRLPVKDPLAGLPTPTTLNASVSPTIHNPADLVVVALGVADASALSNAILNQLPALLRPLFQPLISPLSTLLSRPTIEPGVYNSITVLSPLGGARFEPGIYIVRGVNPATRTSLAILGPVRAEKVLFYVTNSSNYDPVTGLPDGGEDSETAPANIAPTLLPSVLIASLLPNARITGLNDPGSPFDGMLIYQHRTDRRPIIIEAQQLIGSGDISGTIYSKWAHNLFVAGAGSYDLRFVTGTMRVVTVTTTTIAPTTLFPPAQDVLLLE